MKTVQACTLRNTPAATPSQRGTRIYMRRQYHSQQVGSRQFIWDVHRLVDLTKHFPVEHVPLSRIAELDEAYWFEGGRPTCRAIALHARLIAETDLVYPIILSSEGRVMDGMHRVCKALIENRGTIAAVRFERNPEPDYIDADVEQLPYDERPA
jgi:hypothetical protein